MTHHFPDCDLWLYGSRARGDFDETSDLDVLVIGDSDSVVGHLIGRLRDASVSHYGWSEIIAMAEYGSLFLDHVRRDGRRIESRGAGAERFDRVLDALPPYTRARHDLRSFRLALTDCRDSLRDGGWPDFELETLVTVLRHAAILGSYCAGQPDYGRKSAFATIGKRLHYPESVIRELQTAYLMFRRGVVKEVASAKQAAPRLLALAGRFFEDLEGVIDHYEAPPTATCRAA